MNKPTIALKKKIAISYVLSEKPKTKVRERINIEVGNHVFEIGLLKSANAADVIPVDPRKPLSPANCELVPHHSARLYAEHFRGLGYARYRKALDALIATAT